MLAPAERLRDAFLVFVARLRDGRLAIGLTVAILLPGVAEAQTSATKAGFWPLGSTSGVHLANGGPTTAAELDAVADLPYGAGPVLDIEPLLAGERRVVEVPPGSLVQLDDPLFDAAAATYVGSGDDLTVMTANGGVLVLEGFFQKSERPSLLSVLGAPGIPGPIHLRSIRLSEMPDGGEGAPAGAGAEVFSLVPVVRWLVGQLDLGGPAQAATNDDPPPVDDAPVLAQVLAQLRIASANERFGLATAHHQWLRAIEDKIRAWQARGSVNPRQVQALELALLQAKLGVEETALEVNLAIDHHQDNHTVRLTTAPFPKWHIEPPASLDAVRQSIAAGQQAEARRQLRLLHYTRASLALLDQLQPLALTLRNAHQREFDAGVGGIATLLASEATRLEAALAEVDRRLDKMRAEAWLLAATGALDERYIVVPGWD